MYITNMATPLNKNPCPVGYGIYNCGRAFLVNYNYILGIAFNPGFLFLYTRQSTSNSVSRC